MQIDRMFKASYTRARRMVYELNACLCGPDHELVLRHLWTVRIPFAANWTLSVFSVNTRRTGCFGRPFHAPSILCSPQVRGKLINGAPNMRHMRTAQRVSGTLAYTKLKHSYRMYRQFDRMYKQFNRVYRQFDRMYRQFDTIYRQFDRMYKQFDRMYRQFDRMYRQFDRMCRHVCREIKQHCSA